MTKVFKCSSFFHLKTSKSKIFPFAPCCQYPMFDKLAIFFKANFNWHGKSERYSDCVVMYCTCTMVVALSLM